MTHTSLVNLVCISDNDCVMLILDCVIFIFGLGLSCYIINICSTSYGLTFLGKVTINLGT